ncbi:MAG: exodeoxyribonuclease VII large subunit [Pseudomonadota bacterium]
MSLLIDDDPGTGNTPEFSVSELSGAVKRMVEGEFGHVRVRGEVGRVSRPRSGHVYMDLKDDRAVLAGVIWKGVVGRLQTQPEEGMEVIATGKLTTFPGQSKYQIIIEEIAPAGVGALMAMLDKRRKALTAEGLFAPERKQRLPFLPQTIGVVTSPSGAVIRDILHRVAERFPVNVLVWPVAVQGERCAPEVTAAIRGFDALDGSGPLPRPDVLIVARGGGSVEDLWGFNEESVVRAVAECAIPVISAVGHETDTTLIDHAADIRAPTPTAAAELAVPVRGELAAQVADFQARRLRAMSGALERSRQRLSDIARALPRPDQILAERRQRLDLAAARLASPKDLMRQKRAALNEAMLKLPKPGDLLQQRRQSLALLAAKLPPALRDSTQRARVRLMERIRTLDARALKARLDHSGERLETARGRVRPVLERIVKRERDRVNALGRTLGVFSYRKTLERGFSVVRDADGALIRLGADVQAGARLEIEFHDARVDATAGASDAEPAPVPQPRKRPQRKPSGSKTDDNQGSLF